MSATEQQQRLAELKEWNGGTYPAHVDGGYPVVYRFEDGEACCADCANGKNGSIAFAALPIPRGHADYNPSDCQWRIVAAEVFYGGLAEQCSHCGADIESAYGTPDRDAHGV